MPRRKRSTFGTIERPSGRDHWNLKWWETRDGVHRRRSQVVWGTRREAERRLAEIRTSLDETDKGSRQMLTERVTVGQAYERWWLPAAKQKLEGGKLARKTFSQMMSTWRRRVSCWADVPCRKVRPVDIQAWLDPMTAKPAADALAMLRRILDYSMIVGPHVHLDVGNEGIHWAFPLAAQSVVVPEQDGVPALFWAFQEACRITKSLRVEQSLGV